MVATYRLRADEITGSLLETIRNNYRDKEIEITIQEVEDETAYLLKSEANRRHLLRGIEEIQSGTPLQTMTLEQLDWQATDKQVFRKIVPCKYHYE